jgi:hypothetical protein
LRVAAHDLAVKVEARLRILLQRALADELGEVLFALGIDGVRVEVRARREVNFRFADVQEAERVAGGHLAGFLGRHDVVRQLADLGGEFGFGSQGGKRFQGSHKTRREDREAGAGTHEKFPWDWDATNNTNDKSLYSPRASQ